MSSISFDDFKKKWDSLAMKFYLSMGKRNQEILKSEFNTLPEAQERVQPSIQNNLLRGIQQGQISEEARQHHYKLIYLMDQKWKEKHKAKFGAKMDAMGDKSDDYPIELVLNPKPQLLNETAVSAGDDPKLYSPIRTNNQAKPPLEFAANSVHIKTYSGDKKLIEFYIDKYENPNVTNEYSDVTLLEYDQSKFDGERVGYSDKVTRYYVKFYKMNEHNGNYVIKYLTT